ncbi:tRNA N6-adenosine threonylcarbamoyltransferase [Vanrija pseudolonga]|uniref:N(6)-L-threonylcarbamoyladenine synthase n=1 Tax=Vanrija pseudolonga TaxID=143232 RepID=A0AAF0Y568_9TREE|nr:tRNA N6-adenosine threonylcarbamoyltransferase [Vanrija pseudolonga]
MLQTLRQATRLSIAARYACAVAGPSTPRARVRPSSSSAPSSGKPLVVLGLESSADDACAAVVSSDRRILSNVVRKQHHINAQYGGIQPRQAHEAHIRTMPGVIAEALDSAGLSIGEVDAIAYTRGPGMFGCLSVGVNSARAMAAATQKPVLGVHHMQAHALTVLLTEEEPPAFPFLTLLVSGGHSILVLAERLDSYKILLDTLDSAVGQSIDKVARLLRLPHSTTTGLGPVLEKYASAPPLPPYDTAPLPRGARPLSQLKASEAALSFAGLYPALQVRELHPDIDNSAPPEAVQREVARVFQTAAFDHLASKIALVMRGLETPVNGLVVSGGVGSNLALRERLRTMLDEVAPNDTPVPLYYPPIALCTGTCTPKLRPLTTDNAAMIAWVGILRLQAGLKGEPLDLELRKTWSLEDLYDDVPASCYDP